MMKLVHVVAQAAELRHHKSRVRQHVYYAEDEDALFRFKPDDTGADDGSTRFRPTDIAFGDPGRWVQTISGTGGGGGGPGSDTTAIHKGGDIYGQTVKIGTLDAEMLIISAEGGDTMRLSDGVVDLNQSRLLNALDVTIYGGANPAARLYHDGLLFGPGGAGALDWLLQRTGVGIATVGNGLYLRVDSTPINGADSANKQYVDDQIAANLGGATTDAAAWHKTGDTIGADKIIGAIDAAGGYAVKFFVENQEAFRIVDDGDHMQWTGPRLKIGHTGAAFYPNGDIVSIKKNVGDQMCVTMQNPHNNVADPSGCAFILVNNDGTKTGGINMLNDDWTAGGSDGVFPGDYACISFGGPAVYGSQTDANVRFIRNKITMATLDGGYFDIDGCSLRVSGGNILADAAGAVLTLGTAGNAINEGGIKAGKSGQYYFLFNDDATNGFTGTVIQGKASRFARADVVSGGASGSGYGAWSRLINADAKSFDFILPETGFATSFAGKASYGTMSVSAGYGIRCNVNGVDNSGWRQDTDGTFHQFGSIQTYNIFPEGGDGVGSIGDGTHRWSLVRAVTVTSGDLELEDEDFGSRWTLREAKVEGEDVDALYAINRRTGEKFKVKLEAA